MKKFLVLFSVFIFMGFTGLANAATTVVTPSNMQGWGFLQEAPILPSSTGSIVSGPSTPPVGTGSGNLIVGNTGGMILGKLAYPGMRLDSITNLKYSTYRTSGPSAVAVSLQFNIDNNVTDGITNFQGRLVYEPYHTQTVGTSVWETWNTLNDAAGTGTGSWWGSPNGVSLLDEACPQANPCTWSEVLAAFPNIGIHANPALGAVILKAGSGGGAFNGNADKLEINSDIYDFELDGDNDGIADDGTDKCPGTLADNFPQWGKSMGRFMWNGTSWISSKGTPKGFIPNMTYTYGCSGDQILDAMVVATGHQFGGHYKFGVTKSILEEWHAGEYKMETVTVPALDEDGVSSLMNTLIGQDYLLKASGTAFACNDILGGCVIEFDADNSTSDATTWVDGVAVPYDTEGPNLLDLKVDGGFVNWGAYNASHMYENAYTGTGAPLNLIIHDLFYPNNSGNLSVDIVAKLW